MNVSRLKKSGGSPASAVALVLSLTLLPLSVARADGPPAPGAGAAADAHGGDDVVALKNGGMLRGTIVVIEPQKQVVILIQGTGEQRTVPWEEVDKVEPGKYAPAPPPERISSCDT